MRNPGKREILIVGSVPLASAEDVMRTIGTILGDRVLRIPDGETGSRVNWIESQSPIFDSHPSFELTEQGPGRAPDWRNKDATAAFKIKPWHALRVGVRLEDVVFGPLGYARAAQDSFRIFSRLKAEGVIHAACRFQFALPTPYNVIDQRIVPAQRLAVEKAYERRMLIEIDEIAAAIPHAELALQWDAAHEVQNLDGGRPHWFDAPEEGIVTRLARLGDHVPARIELGYHLCYGNFMHKHFIEPKDTGTMVGVANRLSQAIRRPIDWIHMPVPRDRVDDAYFAPLKNLMLRPETRLILGLVHYTDGVAGARRRLSAATKAIQEFGIATECGFAFRDASTIPPLLRLHAEVADAFAAPAQAGA